MLKLLPSLWVKLTKSGNKALGTYHFSVCGGEVNFEGGNRKKADLIKGE